MPVTGEVIAKSKQGIFIAHEISDNTSVPEPAGVFYAPDKLFRVDDFIEESPREALAYFFPLGDDDKGFKSTDAWDAPSLTASTATNYSSDENGIFVGPATTNLWPDQTILHGFKVNSGSGTINKVYSTPAGINAGVELIKTTVGDEFSSLDTDNEAPYTGTGDYSISAYIRHSGGETPATIPNHFELAQGVGGASITNTLLRKYPAVDPISTQWNRIIRSATYTGASTNMSPYIKWDDTTEDDSEYRLYGMQLEKRAFPTPYTNSSRAATQLQFHLYDRTGIALDWDDDWTILYWKKPIGTDNGLTGYSVESLGRNGNSEGGGYTFWGKINAANTIALRNGTLESGDADFTWNDYQYEWQLVVLRYDASEDELKLNIYGVNADPIVITRTIDITASNYYVTQNGYDFQLGGYDLSHQPAAYYRGLTIYKSVKSDTYVDSYYNTKLKMVHTASNLTIYSGIILEEDL